MALPIMLDTLRQFNEQQLDSLPDPSATSKELDLVLFNIINWHEDTIRSGPYHATYITTNKSKTNLLMRPTNLKELKDSDWQSHSVKEELQSNFTALLKSGAPLFPGVVGYENTVILSLMAVLADMTCCFWAKRPAKSRLMRRLANFLMKPFPIWTFRRSYPRRSLSNYKSGQQFSAAHDDSDVPIT